MTDLIFTLVLGIIYLATALAVLVGHVIIGKKVYDWLYALVYTATNDSWKADDRAALASIILWSAYPFAILAAIHTVYGSA